jgi:uncharacterized protein YjbI with pentapeptide repeats
MAKTGFFPGQVSDRILNPAEQFAREPERLTSLTQASLTQASLTQASLTQPSLTQPSLTQLSVFVSGILDGLSYFFFCLSFSSLTHLLGSWWNRFSAEE